MPLTQEVKIMQLTPEEMEELLQLGYEKDTIEELLRLGYEKELIKEILPLGYEKETIKALYDFWMTHSDNREDEDVSGRLHGSYPELLKTIARSPSFFSHINAFALKVWPWPEDELPVIFIPGKTSFYDPVNNTIFIGQSNQL